ncbi:HdeD family acid-resistance protein [Microbacterium kribbense]|uniref:HdeD family acid-resistance protein n=1 Tax=Microbacterium kribbense TaxID=433645 RepID=A0ABP7GNF8_9MICO
MTTATSSLGSSTIGEIRSTVGMTGTVSVFVGLLILVWPLHSAVAFVWVLAIYAAVVGLLYLALGALAAPLGTGRRIGHLVLGLVFIASAVIAFSNAAYAMQWLVTFFGLFLGIAWILEGIAAITIPTTEDGRSWAILFGMLSVIAGIFLVVSPAWGGLVLWGLFAVWLIVRGSVQVMRARHFEAPEG